MYHDRGNKRDMCGSANPPLVCMGGDNTNSYVWNRVGTPFAPLCPYSPLQIPCSCPFKRDMGVDFTIFTIFSFSYVDQKLGYIRSIGPILGATKKKFDVPDRSPGVPVDFKNSICVGHCLVRFSLLNHHISSPGTSENHRRTYGKRSWRYGSDPVHIAYPSTRNTSENRRSIFPKIWHVFTNCPENSFAWNGFSGLIGEISRIRTENQFQAN